MVKVKIRLEISAVGDKEKETIIKTLKPDNKDFPENIIFREEEAGNKIIYLVEGEEEKIKTLRNTIDEILQQIDLLSQNIKVVRREQKTQKPHNVR